MDRRRTGRGGDGGGGGGRRTAKASKRAGYLPQTRRSTQAQTQKDTSQRRRTTTARASRGRTRSRANDGEGGDGGNQGRRRPRSADSHSSDQYLSLSSEDDGAHGYADRFLRHPGRHDDHHNTNHRHTSSTHAEARRAHSRPRSGHRRLSPPSRHRRRASTSHSRTDSARGASEGSADYWYEEEEGHGRTRRRRSRSGPSQGGGRGEGGTRSSRRRLDGRDELASRTPSGRASPLRARGRERSPPPPPRQWPHQPQARKYARQEAAPRAVAAAAVAPEPAAHATAPTRAHNRDDYQDRARPSALPRRGHDYADKTPSTTRSPSLLSTPSSQASSGRRGGEGRAPTGTHNTSARGAVRTEARPGGSAAVHAGATAEGRRPSPPSAPSQTEPATSSTALARTSHPTPTSTPGATNTSETPPPQAAEDEQHVKLTPGEREEQYLTWLYTAKPSTSGRTQAMNAATDLHGRDHGASSSAAAPVPWEQVSAETRFLVTTDRAALGLVDWREVLQSGLDARYAHPSGQGPEEDVEPEEALPAHSGGGGGGGAQSGHDRASDAAGPTREASFMAWAASAAPTPHGRSLRSSALHTPRALAPAEAAATTFPSVPGMSLGTPPTPPQRTPLLLPVLATTAEAGHGHDSRLSSGQLTPLRQPADDLRELPPGMLCAASLTSMPEVEWIPEDWRTHRSTGAVYPSRCFVPRQTFLARADAQSAAAFRWHFDNGFAHRRPPWFICGTFDDNAEHPWACEWLNGLPRTRTLAAQLAVSRANVAARRAQRHAPEEANMNVSLDGVDEAERMGRSGEATPSEHAHAPVS